MPKVTRSAVVSHSPEHMFDLVNDFSRYPEFLPWCAAGRVISADLSEIIGELTLQKGALRHTFSTRNTLTRPELIALSLVSGPFKSLSGAWTFESLPGGAWRVSLNLEFEFSSRLIAMASGGLFSQIAGNLVDAFCDRADALYGAAQ